VSFRFGIIFIAAWEKREIVMIEGIDAFAPPGGDNPGKHSGCGSYYNEAASWNLA
jgi:hypothetical protein